MRRTLAVWIGLVAAMGLQACGGSDSPATGGSGTCSPASSARITLASTGISPKAVCVLPGGTVTFVNGDVATHDMEPVGTCTATNFGPVAAAGTRVVTFPSAQTCNFQDAGSPSSTAFQGTVAVSDAPTTGAGY
jgi:hypothetical protein